MNNLNKEYYIDMSLKKNQYKIANIMSGLISVEEFEQLISLKESFNICSKRNNNINPSIILFEKELSKYNIKIIDILTSEKERFIDLRMSYGKSFQIDFKMKYSKNLKYNLIYSFATAINFINYKGKFDQFIIQSKIIDNFSKILSNELSKDTLDQIKYIVDYSIIIDNNIIEKDTHNFNFSIDNFDFSIISDFNLIKFEFDNHEEKRYIYLPKNKVGISNISLIVEKAIKTKTR